MQSDEILTQTQNGKLVKQKKMRMRAPMRSPRKPRRPVQKAPDTFSGESKKIKLINQKRFMKGHKKEFVGSLKVS